MIDAWNAGDAAAFVAPFCDDADFVAFEGTHLRGASRCSFHQRIFETLVKGSRMEGEVNFVRFLSLTEAGIADLDRRYQQNKAW